MRARVAQRRRSGTPRDVGVEIDDDFVAPDQFRYGDDAAAFERAIAYSRSHNGKGLIGLGRTYFIGPTDFHNVNMVTSQGFGATVFKAIPGSRDGNGTALVRCRDMVRHSWQGVTIDANDEFDIAFDTSWTKSSGPSINSLYKLLLIKGFRTLGWLADNNNDVWNENIVIIEPGRSAPANRRTPTLPLVTAYRNRGPGGPIGFVGCNFLCGPLEVAGQNIVLQSTATRGVRVPAGGGFNTINIAGGHVFADEATGLNFELNGSIAGFVATGTQIENAVPNGAVFGGSGATIANLIALHGVHAMHAGTTQAQPALCRPGLHAFGGGPVTIQISGGQIDGVDIAALGGWARLDAPGTYINGSLTHSLHRQSFDRVAKRASLGPDGLAVGQSAHGTGDAVVGLATYVTTMANNWTEVIEFPTGNGVWTVHVSADRADGPRLVIVVSRSGDAVTSTSLGTPPDVETAVFGVAAGKWRFRASETVDTRPVVWTLMITGISR